MGSKVWEEIFWAEDSLGAGLDHCFRGKKKIQ